MVSKFDYVASGFPLKKEWIQKLQAKINSLFCGLFGLSDRTAHLWLYLPVQFGGTRLPVACAQGGPSFSSSSNAIEL